MVDVNIAVCSVYCRVVGPVLTLLNTKFNPICHFLALLGAHHILHVSRIRVKRKLLSLGLQVTVQKKLELPFGIDQITQDIT
jgi:hypothetical protein